jgi:ATP-binding cassette subfamily B protein
MNTILVMHKGELREAGSHQALVAQRGLYYRLYELQYQVPGSEVPGFRSSEVPRFEGSDV